MSTFIAPDLGRESFTCPCCSTVTQHTWWRVATYKVNGSLASRVPQDDTEEGVQALTLQMARLGCRDYEAVRISECALCHQPTVWVETDRWRMVYPPPLVGPESNPDLPGDVRRDLEEARAIVCQSPRGACALARLAVQKVCDSLEPGAKDINAAIGGLVQKGLPVEVQQALDTVRVIGNSAVHPGELDLRDDRETAVALLELVNFIAEEQISRPKKRAALYDRLPVSAVRAIERRDGSG